MGKYQIRKKQGRSKRGRGIEEAERRKEDNKPAARRKPGDDRSKRQEDLRKKKSDARRETKVGSGKKITGGNPASEYIAKIHASEYAPGRKYTEYSALGA